MWRRRDKSKMGIQTTQRQIEESIKKKSEPQLSDQLKVMSDQLLELTRSIDELKNRNYYPISSAPDNNPAPDKSLPRKMFIPSVSTDGMTVNASKPKKRSRKINLSDSVEKLIKIDKTYDGKN
jgi:hypothetical protein